MPDTRPFQAVSEVIRHAIDICCENFDPTSFAQRENCAGASRMGEFESVLPQGTCAFLRFWWKHLSDSLDDNDYREGTAPPRSAHNGTVSRGRDADDRPILRTNYNSCCAPRAIRCSDVVPITPVPIPPRLYRDVEGKTADADWLTCDCWPTS
jgi:hypothetical protein